MIVAEGAVQCELMEEQYPPTCIPYPFPKLLRGLPQQGLGHKTPRDSPREGL